ncbi:MAG: N-acetylmuramoyl-L-alanine amidase [Lachnospiraceae bacterium]|nr:N-acetylmuramoyl-L-alanine amidase [Lachnospiraceae bacterium]
MAAKIVLDAGHGGWDNGASYNNRKEKDDNLRLTLELGRILEDMGFQVEYTRTEDVYQAPFKKATIGNEKDADLFVSIHRNSSAIPNQYQGVETLIYSEGGFAEEVANNINQRLEEVGYLNLGIEERPNLIVLNSTQMPAVLVEVGFINSEVDNELYEQRFMETAYGIAEGIEDSF